MSRYAVSDMIGNTYGLLTVAQRVGTDENGHSTWLCDCECGGQITLSRPLILKPKKPHCGCLGLMKPQSQERQKAGQEAYAYAQFSRENMW